MAKIDTSRIAGYADMSLEDKLKALEAFEYNDNASELEKQKAAVSKANSEAAEWKRKHNALLSEDEQKKQQQYKLHKHRHGIRLCRDGHVHDSRNAGEKCHASHRIPSSDKQLHDLSRRDQSADSHPDLEAQEKSVGRQPGDR